MDLIEAKRVSLDLAPRPESESVPLGEAPGRVLREDLSSPYALPGEPRSRLDGFAVSSSDVENAVSNHPVKLRIVQGVLAAGHIPATPLQPGECMRILTGAPLPAGADVVIPQENVREEGGRLFVEDSYRRGSGVVSPGADAREGDLLLSRGTVLTPSRLALAAALGYGELPVAGKPRVALLATGDEVREMGEPLDGPWTYCNNRLLLGWLVGLQGGDPVHLGVMKDDPAAIAARLAETEADVTITTGGIGRGERDFILEAWALLGVRTLFREVNLSPGRFSALGVKGKTGLLGISRKSLGGAGPVCGTGCSDAVEMPGTRHGPDPGGFRPAGRSRDQRRRALQVGPGRSGSAIFAAFLPAPDGQERPDASVAPQQFCLYSFGASCVRSTGRQ